MIRAVDILRQRLGTLRPETAIVLGSSLGPVADAVTAPLRIPYRDLPEFPQPKISGHSGEVFAGLLAGKPVLVLRGRGHPYEKGDAAVMRPAIESLQLLGVTQIILTNAAGSLQPKMRPGSIMLITDHINFSGMNPLIGEEGDKGFVPMTAAYDVKLADALRAAARAEAIELHEGVYVWFSGPSFETPAEIRMAQSWGAHAVGMSTVPEVILARRFGLKVAGLSVITNLGAGIEGASPSHEETKSEGVKAVDDMVKLLTRFCAAGEGS
ncbi:purine-nucleoside phosphorylase [Taklimakanibacter lacteus]|uniref:purine-nucleoside phosphorylase n=1 Tax=Taklimakanibacter lacteus TaxID=2268456 RepID=UPI000E666686